MDRSRLRVTYHGAGAHTHDVGAVRSNAPFVTSGDGVCYYEVTIVDAAQRW